MKFIFCSTCGGWTGPAKVSAKLQGDCPKKAVKPYDKAQMMSGHQLVNGKKVYCGKAIPYLRCSDVVYSGISGDIA